MIYNSFAIYFESEVLVLLIYSWIYLIYIFFWLRQISEIKSNIYYDNYEHILSVHNNTHN